MSVSELPDEVQKQRAKELLNRGRLEDARELLSGLCREDQADIEIWSLLGTANGYLGRFEDVASACRKALGINPDYLPALNGLASALTALGQHEEATVQFEALLQRAPDNPAVLNNYGHSLFLMGRMEDARKTLEDAVRIQPHYAEAHYNLAVLLEKTEQPADALREYELAAELKPGLPGINDSLERVRNTVKGST